MIIRVKKAAVLKAAQRCKQYILETRQNFLDYEIYEETTKKWFPAKTRGEAKARIDKRREGLYSPLWESYGWGDEAIVEQLEIACTCGLEDYIDLNTDREISIYNEYWNNWEEKEKEDANNGH